MTEDSSADGRRSPGVLANDTDVDGDALTARHASAAGHGTRDAQQQTARSRTRPTANFHGADSFTYKANDGHRQTRSGNGHDHGQPGQ